MHERIGTPFKKLVQIISLTISYFILTSFPSQSQNNKFSSYASLAEKIYMQLDSKWYTNDQTIWFKSIVTNAIDHTPTKLSGVLYVELIDPNEKIIEKKLIRVEHGIGNGFFQLNQHYTEGLYLIRAYTQWAKNFGPDFFFKEYIRVFTTAVHNTRQHNRSHAVTDKLASTGFPSLSFVSKAKFVNSRWAYISLSAAIEILILLSGRSLK